MEAVIDLIRKLRRADDEARAAIKAELIALGKGPDGAHVRETIEGAMRGEVLEVQWELEEVVEVLTPKKPAPPPKPEPPKAPPKPEAAKAPAKDEPGKPRQISAADLTLMYDDPRGLMLYKTKVGERWFATQVDPRTGQPQTFELHPDEVKAVKQQLAGSPYWVIGGA